MECERDWEVLGQRDQPSHLLVSGKLLKTYNLQCPHLENGSHRPTLQGGLEDKRTYIKLTECGPW